MNIGPEPYKESLGTFCQADLLYISMTIFLVVQMRTMSNGNSTKTLLLLIGIAMDNLTQKSVWVVRHLKKSMSEDTP